MQMSLVFVASLAIFCIVEGGGADKCDGLVEKYASCRRKGFPSALGCVSTKMRPSKKVTKKCKRIEKAVKKCDSPCAKPEPGPDFDASDKSCALDGYDFVGADLRDFQSSGYEECSNACNDEDGCKSFALRKSDNNCWLKSKFGGDGPMPNDNFISRNMECNTKELDLSCARDGQDFVGSDVRHFESTSLEDCARVCRMTEDCRSLTLRKSDNYCWLKSKTGEQIGPTPNDALVSMNINCRLRGQ